MNHEYNSNHSKKHPRSVDESDEDLFAIKSGKRLRLDKAFQSLNLDLQLLQLLQYVHDLQHVHNIHPSSTSSDPPTPSDPSHPADPLEINPSVTNKFQFGNTITTIDDYLTHKMMQDYSTMVNSSGQIIPKYQPELLVIYHFQKWVTRLFNRFLAKYNRINDTKIPKFKNFFKIITVIQSHQYNFSYKDLFDVVFQESELELKAVIDRLSRPKSALEEIEEESVTFNDIKYNYWDTIQGLDVDIEMEEGQDLQGQERQDQQGQQDQGEQSQQGQFPWYQPHQSHNPTPFNPFSCDVDMN